MEFKLLTTNLQEKKIKHLVGRGGAVLLNPVIAVRIANNEVAHVDLAGRTTWATTSHAAELAELLSEYQDTFVRYINSSESNIDAINTLKQKVHLDNLIYEALTSYKESLK